MNKDQDLIWYASYGSNILEARFLCYIKGGKPIGAEKEYRGCHDKSLPKANDIIHINYELYFAEKSKTWDNGGVGFIKTEYNQNCITLGRMYLIQREQFIDIVKQETNNTNNLTIDFKKTIIEGSIIIKEKSWYGNLIYLGEKNNFPIFTFTNKETTKTFNEPSKPYLKTIIKGIKETYNHTNNEIAEYFITKSGIKGNITLPELTKFIASEVS
jgi:hypothetical protein